MLGTLFSLLLLASGSHVDQVTGTWTLYEERSPSKVAGAMTIASLGGNAISVQGDSWEGKGIVEGHGGHYDWWYTSGAEGSRTTFRIADDGTLHGTVGGNAGWTFIARKGSESGSLGMLAQAKATPKTGSGKSGPRDTSTLEKTLLGHWATGDGVTDFYFGPGTLVMMDNGNRVEETWTVKSKDDKKSTLTIEVKVVGQDSGPTRRLIFRKDKKSIDQAVIFDGEEPISTEWVWVDTKQSPP